MKVVAGLLLLLLVAGCASSSTNSGYKELPLWQSQEIKLDGDAPRGLSETDLQEIMLLMARTPGMNRHKVRFVHVTEETVTVFAQPLPAKGVPISETYKTRKLDFTKEKVKGWVVTRVGSYLDP